MAGGITLNPVVIATLTGVGLIEKANFARVEYKKILDEIRFYLRGEPFNEKAFLDRLKMINDFVSDHCTGLPSSVCAVDCAINGFIVDQISLSKGDALGF